LISFKKLHTTFLFSFDLLSRRSHTHSKVVPTSHYRPHLIFKICPAMAVNITDYVARLETSNSIFHINPDGRNWSIKRLIFCPAFSVFLTSFQVDGS